MDTYNFIPFLSLVYFGNIISKKINSGNSDFLN